MFDFVVLRCCNFKASEELARIDERLKKSRTPSGRNQRWCVERDKRERLRRDRDQ
jgi:hypothetical protein